MALKEKTIPTDSSTTKAKVLLDKLYELRKAFEADYSGALRSRKYEATRNFTIDLNHAIFEANQMTTDGSNEDRKIALLANSLKELRQDFKMLFI